MLRVNRVIIHLFLSGLFLAMPFNALAYGTDYRFTGKPFDSNANLYDFGARNYQPDVGRFIQPDPVQNVLTNPEKLKQMTGQDLNQILMNPQALNPYSYVQNNPVRYIDPEGESVRDVIRGRQSLPQFQIEVGENTEIRYQDNRVWRAVLDNPYIFGGALALGTPLIAAGINALVGGTSLIASLGLAGRALPPILISQSQRIFNGFQNLKNKDASAALVKLQEVSKVIGKSVDFILKQASKSESVFTDLRALNYGNVNIFFINPVNNEKLIRVTLDPTLNKIISAGFDRINQVTTWINEGQLINFTK